MCIRDRGGDGRQQGWISGPGSSSSNRAERGNRQRSRSIPRARGRSPPGQRARTPSPEDVDLADA
eukprot:1408299-Alexandrium_andersonii.AAC.1